MILTVLLGIYVMAAAASGNSEAVRVLLEEGAAVDSQDGDGWTALMVAAHEVILIQLL